MASKQPSQIESQIENFLEHFRYVQSMYQERQQCLGMLDIMDKSTTSSDDNDINKGPPGLLFTSQPRLLHLTSQAPSSTSPSSDYMSSTSSFNSLEDTESPTSTSPQIDDSASQIVPRTEGNTPFSGPSYSNKVNVTDTDVKLNQILNEPVVLRKKPVTLDGVSVFKPCEETESSSNSSQLVLQVQAGDILFGSKRTSSNGQYHSVLNLASQRLSYTEVKYSTSLCSQSQRSSLCESDYKSVKSVYSETELRSLKSSYWSLCGSFSSLVSINKDYVMGESSCRLTILDVADILQAQYAFISGGKCSDGAALLTFPDVHALPELNEQQYRNLVLYLASIPSLQDTDAGFSVVIDRRKDKWSAVKSLLNKIKNYFPVTLSCVYVIKPAGFLQKTFGNIGKDNIKDNYSFKIILCTGQEELHKEIDPCQLTADVGGTLDYDHKDWVNHRAAVEKFSANTTRLGDNLRHWCEKLQQLEFPNDVEATNKLIREHEQAHQEISDDLESTLKHGDILLKCFKTIHDSEGEELEIDTANLPVCKIVHVTAIERLVSQLEETNQNFNDFWLKHEKKLAQCLQLRQFEDQFKTLHSSVLDHVDMISKMTDSGDTLQQVSTLFQQLQQFEENSQPDVDAANDLYDSGHGFIEADHYAVDCIRPKCMELQRVCAQYRELVRKRRDLLTKSQELQQRIDKATSWYDEGISLLASQQLDRFNTSNGAQNALTDLDNFLSTSAEFQLGDMGQLHEQYEPVISPTHQISIEETLKKIDNLHDMCDKRRNSLQKLINKPKQTVVVQPQPHASPISTASRQINHMSTESDKQGHVIRELIDTENTYVSELETILRGYKQEMDAKAHLLPLNLKGQGDILFGNLEQIYEFHSCEFMKELAACSHDPASVGRCFVKQSDGFSMYSDYCQNKPASDALICEVSDNNPFFKECQSKLGHKLPLSAYLLKPVQRITKYQLLLKEMLKATSDISHQKELEEAITVMVNMLTYVNDVMHSTAIMGYPGRLSQLGKLRLQGSFSISYENKKDKTIIQDKLNRLKIQQRQVFVYENYVMFCKKREENSRHGSSSRAGYMYKSELETSLIGLTESVRGDRKKFELWKGQRTEIYTLTAPNIEVKDLWVREIKKLLQVQFDKIKERSLSQHRVATVPIKKVLQYSPSVTSPTERMPIAEGFPNNNNVEEEIMQAAFQPTSAASRDVQGNVSTENSYDDTSWSGSDEFVAMENIQSGYKYYAALADYNAMGNSEITMRESDIVEVLQIGHQGWWYVRHLASEVEGWVPAGYLETAKRRSTISSNSMNSMHSSHSLHTSHSSGSFGKEISSATEV